MNKNSKEKVCTFYVSDYHFEMISLPYIDKNLSKKDIIILTENNLEKTIETLISRMNFKEDKKKKIFQIDWKNNDMEKFKKIKEDADNNKEMIIFIKGKENYIKNINKNIEKWTEKTDNVKIIDCYDMEEISGKMNEIMDNYKILLSTSGEKAI